MDCGIGVQASQRFKIERSHLNGFLLVFGADRPNQGNCI